jgi:hypothetical protein
VVRLRRDEDLQPLVGLLRSVYSADDYPANWPDDPVRWLAASGTIAAWIFEHGSELVGHLALTAPDPSRHGRSGRRHCGNRSIGSRLCGGCS